MPRKVKSFESQLSSPALIKSANKSFLGHCLSGLNFRRNHTSGDYNSEEKTKAANRSSQRPHSVDVLDRLGQQLPTSTPQLSDNLSVSLELTSGGSVPCVLAPVDTSGSAFQRYCDYRRSLNGIEYTRVTRPHPRTSTVRSRNRIQLAGAELPTLMITSDYGPSSSSLPSSHVPRSETSVTLRATSPEPIDLSVLAACMTVSDYGPMMMTRSETDETLTGDITPTAGQQPGNLASLVDSEATLCRSRVIDTSKRQVSYRTSLYHAFDTPANRENPPFTGPVIPTSFSSGKIATVKRSNSVPVHYRDSTITVQMDAKTRAIYAVPSPRVNTTATQGKDNTRSSIRERTVAFFRHRSRSNDRSALQQTVPLHPPIRSKSPFSWFMPSRWDSREKIAVSRPTEEETSKPPRGGSFNVVMRRKSRSRDKKTKSCLVNGDPDPTPALVEEKKRTSVDRFSGFFRSTSRSSKRIPPRVIPPSPYMHSPNGNEVMPLTSTPLARRQRDEDITSRLSLPPSSPTSKPSTPAPQSSEDFVSNLASLAALLEQRATFLQSLEGDFSATTSPALPINKVKLWLRTGKDRVKAKHRRLFDRYPADTIPTRPVNSCLRPSPADPMITSIDGSLPVDLGAPSKQARRGSVASLVHAHSTTDHIDLISNQFSTAVSLRRAYKHARISEVEKRSSSGRWSVSTSSLRQHGITVNKGGTSPPESRHMLARTISKDSAVEMKDASVASTAECSDICENQLSVSQRTSTLSADSALVSLSSCPSHSPAVAIRNPRCQQTSTTAAVSTETLLPHTPLNSRTFSWRHSRDSTRLHTPPIPPPRIHSLVTPGNLESTPKPSYPQHVALAPMPAVDSKLVADTMNGDDDEEASEALVTSITSTGVMPAIMSMSASAAIGGYDSWLQRLPYKSAPVVPPTPPAVPPTVPPVQPSSSTATPPSSTEKQEDVFGSWPRSPRKSLPQKRASICGLPGDHLNKEIRAVKEGVCLVKRKETTTGGDRRPTTLYICSADERQLLLPRLPLVKRDGSETEKSTVIATNGNGSLSSSLQVGKLLTTTTTVEQVSSMSPEDDDEVSTGDLLLLSQITRVTSTSVSTAAPSPTAAASNISSRQHRAVSISSSASDRSSRTGSPVSTSRSNLDSPSLGQYSRLYSLRGMSEGPITVTSRDSNGSMGTPTATTRSRQLLADMKHRHSQRQTSPLVDEAAVLSVIENIKVQTRMEFSGSPSPVTSTHNEPAAVSEV